MDMYFSVGELVHRRQPHELDRWRPEPNSKEILDDCRLPSCYKSLVLTAWYTVVSIQDTKNNELLVYQESKTPDDIARWDVGTCKSLHHNKVMLYWYDILLTSLLRTSVVATVNMSRSSKPNRRNDTGPDGDKGPLSNIHTLVNRKKCWKSWKRLNILQSDGESIVYNSFINTL